MSFGLRRRMLLQAGTAFAVPTIARAQDGYPDKPVRIVVSYGPGGAIDVIARILAEHMTNTLRQTMVVENKPGAGATIAADLIARAAPDGYNVLVTGMAHSVMPELFPQAKLDPIKSFQPVSYLGLMPFVLAVNPTLPVKDFESFVAYVKAHPGTINCGSAGPGSSADLGEMLLAKMAGLDFVRVPYRSTPAAMNDLVAGRVGFMMDSQNVLIPHIKSGALRALAVTSLERSRRTRASEERFTSSWRLRMLMDSDRRPITKPAAATAVPPTITASTAVPSMAAV